MQRAIRTCVCTCVTSHCTLHGILHMIKYYQTSCIDACTCHSLYSLHTHNMRIGIHRKGVRNCMCFTLSYSQFLTYNNTVCIQSRLICMCLCINTGIIIANTYNK